MQEPCQKTNVEYEGIFFASVFAPKGIQASSGESWIQLLFADSESRRNAD
jgi:hypothetical protein